jgi:hypothetical protein
MKTWIKVLICIGVVAFIAFIGMVVISLGIVDSNIRTINSQCPLQIDELTSFKGVSRNGFTISQIYEISDDGKFITDIVTLFGGDKIFSEYLINNGCDSGFMQNYGLDIRTIYISSDGETVFDVTSTEKFCKNR